VIRVCLRYVISESLQRFVDRTAEDLIWSSSPAHSDRIDEGRMRQVAQGLGGALAGVDKDILVADVRRQGVFCLRQRLGQ